MEQQYDGAFSQFPSHTRLPHNLALEQT